jgi:hypothetical protein
MNGYLIYDFDLERLKELNPGLTENEIISMVCYWPVVSELVH